MSSGLVVDTSALLAAAFAEPRAADAWERWGKGGIPRH